MLVTNELLKEYLREDSVNKLLDEASLDNDEQLVCQKWLRQTPAKRYIYQALYGDLLGTSERLKVLDVGGGITSLTRCLASTHEYHLVDLLAHDNLAVAKEIMTEVDRDFIFPTDWADLELQEYDLVVANDLFPNVDQRLELFLQKLLPSTKTLRISLTWYTEPRYYMTRRLDADEIFCMLAWDQYQLQHVLEKFQQQLVGFDMQLFQQQNGSVYPNGRQVCLAEFTGALGK